MKYFYNFLFVLISLNLSCQYLRAQEVLRYDVGKVGESIISLFDMKYDNCINEGMNLNSNDILVMIINKYIELEIANKFKLLPTDSEINKLYEHVEKTTKLPDTLKKIKNCYSNDLNSYKKFYLKPIIINKKLTTFFAYDTTIQQKPRSQINKAFELVSKGQSFESVAKKMSLICFYDTINVSGDYKYDSTNSNFNIIDIIKILKPGDLYPKIIESNIQFSIVSLVSLKNNKAILIYLVENKLIYDNWIHEVGNFPITLNDKDQINSIKSKYPSLWWIKNLILKR